MASRLDSYKFDARPLGMFSLATTAGTATRRCTGRPSGTGSRSAPRCSRTARPSTRARACSARARRLCTVSARPAARTPPPPRRRTPAAATAAAAAAARRSPARTTAPWPSSRRWTSTLRSGEDVSRVRIGRRTPRRNNCRCSRRWTISPPHFEDDGDDAKALEDKKKKEEEGLLAAAAGALAGALTGGGAPSGSVGHDDDTLAVAVAWLLIDAGADVHAVARDAAPLRRQGVLGLVLGSYARCRGKA